VKRAPAVVGGVALAALLLAGCAAGGGASEEPPVTDPTPTEQTDSGLDGRTEIPETYPLDEVPLIDGEVAFAIDLGTGWTVVIEAEDFAAGYGEAATLLEGVGFEAVANDASPQGTFGQFTTETYTVNISATDSPDFGNSVSYTVVLNG
jgi:hypothetical protein